MASEGRISLVKDIVDSALYYYQRVLFDRSAFAILSTIAFIGRME